MAIGVHNVSNNSFQLTANPAAGTEPNFPVMIRDVPERYLVVAIAIRSNTGSVNAGSVVYRAQSGNAGTDQSLTFLGALSHSTQALRTEYWGLLAPNITISGSTVRFAGNVAVRASAGAVCYQGVDQTTPFTGYPAVPSLLTTGQGLTVASPLGETTPITCTTVAGDMMVDAICLDQGAVANNFKSPNDEDLVTRPSTGAASANVRLGMSRELATGASTSMKWKSYVGGSTSYPSGQSGRSYTHIAFPLKPSTSNAPYYVPPPSDPVAVGGTSLSQWRFVSIADFPVQGAMLRGAAGATTGPYETGTSSVNSARNAYVSHTAVIITALSATSPGSSHTLGDIVMHKTAGGNGLGATLALYIPTGVAEDDVMIVNFYNEGAIGGGVGTSSLITQASFTEIGTHTTLSADNTEMRQTLFGKRMSAADASGTALYTFTLASGSSFRTAAASFYRGCITSRTPWINSVDDAGSTALPVTTTGSTGNTVTSGAITTTAANQTTLICATRFFGDTYWTPPAIAGGCAEREEYFNCYIAEAPRLTASAVAAQALITSATTDSWSTMTVTLIPNVANNSFPRTISTPSITGTRTVSRLMNPYIRAIAMGTSVALTLTRRVNPYKRAGANASISMVMTVARVPVKKRQVQNASIVPSVLAVRRMNPYKRATINNGAISILVAGGTTGSSVTTFTRNVANTIAGSRVLTRKMNPYIRATSNGSITITMTLVKRQNPLRRNAANTMTAGTRTVTRKMSPYKRSVTRVGTVTLALTGGTVGTITWSDYKAPSGEPIILKINDIPGTYPGCTFRLEVQMKSTLSATKVYARMVNIDTGQPVANSQVETSAPHSTSQVVRSAAVGLDSLVRYKAQFGKSTGFVEPSYARVGVRSVA